MDMYKIINNLTGNARRVAFEVHQHIIRNNEDLFKSNPHTSIYRILDAIDEFNKLQL